jgi:hypothetical protein
VGYSVILAVLAILMAMESHWIKVGIVYLLGDRYQNLIQKFCDFEVFVLKSFK